MRIKVASVAIKKELAKNKGQVVNKKSVHKNKNGRV